ILSATGRKRKSGASYDSNCWTTGWPWATRGIFSRRARRLGRTPACMSERVGDRFETGRSGLVHPPSPGVRMTSQAIRDPVTDALLTPKNAALIIIDYQPVQVNSIKSMDHASLVENIVRVAKTAKTYGL